MLEVEMVVRDHPQVTQTTMVAPEVVAVVVVVVVVVVVMVKQVVE